MTSVFYKIYLFLSKNKLRSSLLFLVITTLLAWKTSQLHFEEDITRMLPKSNRTTTLSKALSQLDFSDKIVVLISLKDSENTHFLTQTAQIVLDSLLQYKKYIQSIQGQYDESQLQESFKFVHNHLPLFLVNEDYEIFQSRITTDSIRQRVSANYRTLTSPAAMVAKPFILADPLGFSLVGLNKLKDLGIGDEFQLTDGFITTKNGQHLLLFIDPLYHSSETEHNAGFVSKMNYLKDELNSLLTQTEINYFGSMFIAVANANQIKNDVITTVLLSMLVLLLFIVFYYKNISVPFLLFLPTAFGVLVALSFLSFYRGTISAISVSIGSILLGVTIDYSLHILTHLKKYPQIDKFYLSMTQPILMSSLTTSISFLCLLFVKSEALKDLGLFASISVVVASVFALISIPILYKPQKTHCNSEKSWLERVSHWEFHHNKLLVFICIIIVIFGLFTFQKVSYNNNLSELNYIPSDIKNVEKQLENISNITSKSIYIVAYGNSEQEVLEKNEKLFQELTNLKNNGTILNFSSVGGIFLSEKEQQHRIENWNDFWKRNNPSQLQATLIEEGEQFGFKPSTHKEFYHLLNKSFKPITKDEYKFLEDLIGKTFINSKDGLYTMTNILKVSDNQRDNVVEKFNKHINEYLVIDRQQLNESFLGQLKDDFNNLINYSFLAVFLVLFAFFRRIELAILSMLPIVLTTISIGGLMYFCGIELNIFSTIVCTLVFGIGVDFSIFMTSALCEKYTTGKDYTASFRTSMLLAVLTTIASIGTLIFAKHPALKSISSVALIGVLLALFISFVLYPILFNFFIVNRPQKGQSPITLKLFTLSVIPFVYYGIGGLLTTIFGKLVLFFVPNISEKPLFGIKKFIIRYSTLSLYMHPFIRKKIINPYRENFSKPAVIIANHTSVIDTLSINMLTHKIVYLVNDWVYNSPTIKGMAQIAAYYPVSRGIEASQEELKKKVNQGFSLMIFPEGTRSYNQTIRRFHKGAFYIAQVLKLDILPVYIHGNSEILPKGDYILYGENSITIEIGKRIAYNDNSFGITYSDRCKSIQKYFRENFEKIRCRIEKHDYFNQNIARSFLYKSNFLYSKIRKDLEIKSPYYYQIHLWVNTKNIYHIADDYGQTDCYLALFDAQRKIVTYLADNYKKQVARLNYLTTVRTIYYVDALVLPTHIHTLIVGDFNHNGISFVNNFTKQIILTQPNVYWEEELLKRNYVKKEEILGMMLFTKDVEYGNV